MKRDQVALVGEDLCIGCTRCIDACPVDAIVGAQGLMHSVVEAWCIGCRLCVPPCPVDCIDMVAPRSAWTPALKRAAGRRAKKRQVRLQERKVVSSAADRKAVLAAALKRR